MFNCNYVHSYIFNINFINYFVINNMYRFLMQVNNIAICFSGMIDTGGSCKFPLKYKNLPKKNKVSELSSSKFEGKLKPENI